MESPIKNDNMGKQIKLVLDAIGIVISFSSLVLLYIQEYYLVAFFIAFLCLLLILLAFKHYLAKPVKYHSLHHYFDIKDSSGKKASWKKVSELTPLNKNVTTIVDGTLTSRGKLRAVDTNIGTLVNSDCQGSSISSATYFDPPLPVGVKIKKEITIDVVNGFTDNELSEYWIPLSKLQELGFHITLPKNRPCKGMPIGTKESKGSYESVVGARLNDKATQIDWVIYKPELGAKYMIRWNW